MSTIAEFRVPAADLLLAEAFDRLPRLVVRLESSISKSMPSLWISGATHEEIDAALEADPSVASHELLVETSDRLLYDFTCASSSRRVCDELLEEGGSLLEATGSDGSWHVKMRFADRSGLSRTHDRLDDAGTRIEIVRVAELTDDASGHPRLTPEQREALSAAFEHGYFEIPRRISMEELADELDISHQALSERLRRAYGTLVDDELQPAGGR